MNCRSMRVWCPIGWLIQSANEDDRAARESSCVCKEDLIIYDQNWNKITGINSQVTKRRLTFDCLPVKNL